MVVRQLDEVLAALLKEAAVGRIGDCFGHEENIDDDVVNTSGFHHADAVRRLNADHEQGIHHFFTNALGSAGEAGGVKSSFGLEVGFTGEVLDAGVFEPVVDDGFVGVVVGVLQTKQAGNQRRSKAGRQVRATKWAAKVRSVSFQSMTSTSFTEDIGVEHFNERLLRHSTSLWNNWLRSNKCTSKFDSFRYGIISFLAN